MSLFEGIRSYYQLFGTKGLFLVTKSRVLGQSVVVEAVTKGVAHPIYLRLRTSDASIFEEIILNGEYDFEVPEPPRTIVDAGANIGLASIFFANRFPKARIVAIEPDQSNFSMLQKNVAPYKNVSPVLGALWGESVMLTLMDAGTGYWGFYTRELASADESEERIPGMTVDSIMETFDLEYIDVLKIDIEGAEKEVFSTASRWIDRVGLIIIELHDRLKGGCSESVHGATKDFVSRVQRGETVFLAREPCAVAVHPSSGTQTSSHRASPRQSCKILTSHKSSR